MGQVKKSVIFALLAAIPIEALNFMVFGAMLDPGPADPTWRWKLISYEWTVLHMPGLLSWEFLERVSRCRQLSFPGGCGRVDVVGLFALFGIGYLDTVLLVFLLILGLRWLHGLTRPLVKVLP